MKKFFLSILILFLSLPCFSLSDKVSLDLLNQHDEKANKILFEYLLSVTDMTTEEIGDYPKITEDNVRAVRVDLNDDGVEEVIGFVYSLILHRDSGYELFILENNDNIWQDIAYRLNFEPVQPIEILKKKSDYYNNIKFLTTENDNQRFIIARFKNGNYIDSRF